MTFPFLTNVRHFFANEETLHPVIALENVWSRLKRLTRFNTVAVHRYITALFEMIYVLPMCDVVAYMLRIMGIAFSFSFIVRLYLDKASSVESH